MRRRSKSRKEKRVVQRLAAAMRKLSLHNGPVGVTQEAEGSSNTARTMPRAFVKRPLQRKVASRAKGPDDDGQLLLPEMLADEKTLQERTAAMPLNVVKVCTISSA